MWLWLLIPTLSLLPSFVPAPSSIAYAVETGNGPSSQQEAEILWQDGQKAYEDGRYQDAVNNLERLLARYPGSTGYLDAHRLLGRSFMELGRNEEAVKPLKDYISAAGTRTEALQTRLWLGETYLRLSKPNEAYLTSIEVEKATAKKDPELYARSQFLKAHSLMSLNQDTRAARVLDSVETTPTVQSDVNLRADAANARINLKLRSCSKYPASGPMDEQQVRDQFTRRALCLQEALVQFKTAAEGHEMLVGEKAGDQIADAFASYGVATKHPPEPPKMHPTPRTAVQTRQYRAELIDKLEQDRQKILKDALSSLNEWKEKASSKAAISYGKLSKKIEALL